MQEDYTVQNSCWKIFTQWL